MYGSLKWYSSAYSRARLDVVRSGETRREWDVLESEGLTGKDSVMK